MTLIQAFYIIIYTINIVHREIAYAVSSFQYQELAKENSTETHGEHRFTPNAGLMWQIRTVWLLIGLNY